MTTRILKSFGMTLFVAILPTVGFAVESDTLTSTGAATLAPSVTPPIAPSAAPTVAPPVTPPIAPSAAPTVAPPVTPPIAPSAAPTVAPPVTSSTPTPFASGLKISERPPLLVEGAYLTQVGGSLEPIEGDRGWQFRFRDSFEGEPDRVVQLLPSITLADMIRTYAQLKSGLIAKFSITGKVTLYRGSNYVMPLFATVISEFPPQQSRPTLAPPGAWYGSSQALQLAEISTVSGALAAKQAAMALVRQTFLSLASPLSPQALAAESSQKQKFIGGISAEDIEQELVARVGDIQRSMDAPRLPALNPNATNEMKWLQPGRRVHDRLGTVMCDPVNGVWRFVFESSRGRVGEREAELLPCTLTESLTKQARSSGGLASGLLSGEITLFEGRSYILPTSFRTLSLGKLLSR